MLRGGVGEPRTLLTQLVASRPSGYYRTPTALAVQFLTTYTESDDIARNQHYHALPFPPPLRIHCHKVPVPLCRQIPTYYHVLSPLHSEVSHSVQNSITNSTTFDPPDHGEILNRFGRIPLQVVMFGTDPRYDWWGSHGSSLMLSYWSYLVSPGRAYGGSISSDGARLPNSGILHFTGS